MIRLFRGASRSNLLFYPSELHPLLLGRHITRQEVVECQAVLQLLESPSWLGG